MGMRVIEALGGYTSRLTAHSVNYMTKEKFYLLVVFVGY